MDIGRVSDRTRESSLSKDLKLGFQSASTAYHRSLAWEKSQESWTPSSAAGLASAANLKVLLSWVSFKETCR